MRETELPNTLTDGSEFPTRSEFWKHASIPGFTDPTTLTSADPVMTVEQIDMILLAMDRAEQPKADIPLVITDADLNPDTAQLVTDFAQALGDKLLAAEMKYGYSNGWMNGDWMDECRDKLREHLEKGDPRDVAAYCAFLWFHNEPTAKQTEQAEQANGRAEDAINKTFDLFEAIQKAGGRIDITDQMVERGASTSTTGRQSDPEYRDKIRLILDVALNG